MKKMRRQLRSHIKKISSILLVFCMTFYSKKLKKILGASLEVLEHIELRQSYLLKNEKIQQF